MKRKNRSITKQMAEEIQSCMKGDVTIPMIIRVVRSYYKPTTNENNERDKMILMHYEKLAEIEKRHKEDCKEEKKEYIKKAKLYKKNKKEDEKKEIWEEPIDNEV